MTELQELIDGPAVKQPGQWRRSGDNGPPIVTHPNGATVKSGPRKGEPVLLTYSRPSNFGKQVENTFNLEKWSERMVALGVCSAIADEDDEFVTPLLDGDHDSREWKQFADGVVVEAKRVAGAMLKAEQGTHGHLVTEDSDLERSVVGRIEAGEDVGLPANLQAAIAEVWQRLIDDHFEVLAVEFPCVYDRWRVAGTGDRIVRLKHDLEFDGRRVPAGTVIVLDIKTGGLKLDAAGHPNYWHAYAVQVAAYAYSVPYDVDTETRGEWPWDINDEHGIIAHIDIGGALDTDVLTAQLFYVDLVAGWQAGELVCQAKDWQKRRDVFSTADHYTVAATVPAGPSELRAAGDGDRYGSDSVVVSDEEASPAPASSTLEVPALRVAADLGPAAGVVAAPAAVDRSVVEERARALADAGHIARLVQAWPVGISGLRTEHPHTDDELAAILAAVRRVEDHVSAPFHPADAPAPDPGERFAAVRMPADMLDNTGEIHPHAGCLAVDGMCVEPDEGPTIDADQYDNLKALFRSLPDTDRQRLEQITAQAKAAGTPISLTDNATVRRYEIARALIAWCQAGWDEEIVRDVLGTVLDTVIVQHPAMPLGAAVGALTLDEAVRFGDLARALLDLNSVLTNTDGRWTVTPAKDT